jgi:hypothetical protein
MSTTTVPHKDLTKEAPRSPRTRIDGYVILGRTIDKCHAAIANKLGEYHFDCPLDNMLFGFKGVKGDDFRKVAETGASDAELAGWLDENGNSKTPAEVREWSDSMEKATMVNDPEKKDYFIAECKKVGLDPYKASLFDWLEADDKASFQK